MLTFSIRLPRAFSRHLRVILISPQKRDPVTHIHTLSFEIAHSQKPAAGQWAPLTSHRARLPLPVVHGSGGTPRRREAAASGAGVDRPLVGEGKDARRLVIWPREGRNGRAPVTPREPSLSPGLALAVAEGCTVVLASGFLRTDRACPVPVGTESVREALQKQRRQLSRAVSPPVPHGMHLVGHKVTR